MLASKRKLAVEWSVENIIKGKPEDVGKGRRAYFWTLTTPDECEAAMVLKRWNSFRTVLTRFVGKVEFVRVLEPHANGLRFHLHVIFNQFFDVRWFREKAQNCGFGRVHVVRVRNADLGGYLSKYFTKSLRLKKLHGVKLFGASLRNQTWYRVRICDVEYLEDGKPLSEEFKQSLFLWKRSGGTAGQARMELMFWREHEPEVQYRHTFREWARNCRNEGDEVGWLFWSGCEVGGLHSFEVEVVCDENGLTSEIYE